MTDHTLRVFISYRRSDCQAQANGLHDGLVHRLPGANVFMDIDSIPYGVDFEQHIRQAINSCNVVLVLIGDDWLDTTGGDGHRRLDDPEDFVRLEIENALKTPSVKVVPVLVEGASMPRAADLPASIQRLARLNAIELSDRRWKADLRTLTAVVEELGLAPTPTSFGDLEDVPTVGLGDIDAASVRSAVQRSAEQFQTKDISLDSDVVMAHGAVAEARNYHAMVGRHLKRNAADLGIRSIGKSTNGRGERWQREPRDVSPVAAPAPAVTALAPSAAPTPAAPAMQNLFPPPQRFRASPGAYAVRALMVILPVMTMGLAAWAPALWASTKRDDDARARRRLQGAAGALGLGTLVSWSLVGASDETATTFDVGMIILLSMMAIGTTVAGFQRNAGIEAEARRKRLHHTPWMQQALAGREAREHHRQLARQDPRLAQLNNVGRPDLPRTFDDGGLLDFNSLPSEALVDHARLGPEEARAVVAARERFGRLSSVEELIVHAGVDGASADRLREYAIFL